MNVETTVKCLPHFEESLRSLSSMKNAPSLAGTLLSSAKAISSFEAAYDQASGLLSDLLYAGIDEVGPTFTLQYCAGLPRGGWTPTQALENPSDHTRGFVQWLDTAFTIVGDLEPRLCTSLYQKIVFHLRDALFVTRNLIVGHADERTPPSFYFAGGAIAEN